MSKKEINSAVIFKNFTNEDFVGHWDGVEYTFKAGQETYIELWKAMHFAKHLIDRELNKKNVLTNDKMARQALEKQAVVFPEEVVKENEIIDANAKKAKAPKAKASSKAKAPKKEVEEEFEDLNK